MRKLKVIPLFLLLLVTLFFQCTMPGEKPVGEDLVTNNRVEGSRIAPLPIWDKNTTYNGGEVVLWKDKQWSARWWTKGDEPGSQGEWGVWKYLAPGPGTDKIPPSVPADLMVVSQTGNSCRISWTPSTDNVVVIGYKVYSNGVFTQRVTAPEVELRELIHGSYSIQVSAFDQSNNESAKSAPLTVNINGTIDTKAPSVPTNLAAANVTTTEITLNWDDSTDDVAVSGYKLYRNGNTVSTVKTSQLVISRLTPETVYTFTVSAFDAAGNESAKSAPIKVTTLKQTTPAVEEWLAGKQYNLGDKVAYQNKGYTCTYAHRAAAGWEPPNVPTLWKYYGPATPTPVVELSLTAGSYLVKSGQSVTLTWSAKNAATVTASGGWTGSKPLSGSELTPAITANSEFTLTATDANGKSVSQTVKVRVEGTQPAGNRVMVGYWHNFDNGSGFIRLKDVTDNFDVLNVSFAEPTTPTSGILQFVPYGTTEAEFIADVKSKQAKGIKVQISIGGALGQVKLETQEAKNNFIRTAKEIITKYGFDGLDVDFEGHSLSLNTGDVDIKNPTTPLIVNTIDALKQITAHFGPDFMLTFAPETFFVQVGYTHYGGIGAADNRAGAYLPVLDALRDRLTYLHVQHYNSGSIIALDGTYYAMGNADFHVAMAEMVLKGFPVAGDPNNFFAPLREDQVLIGLPANVNAGGGFTAVAEVQKAVDYIVKGKSFGGRYKLQNPSGYPGFKGLMTWSVNWDQFNNFEFSREHRAYLDSL